MFFAFPRGAAEGALLLLGVAACSAAAHAPDTETSSLGATTPPQAARILINEVLANELGTDPRGEMIELVNPGAADIDLTGYTLSDGVAVRHTFGTISLPAGRAIAVFAAASAVPAGLANAVTATTGALGLSNGGDTVTLADPSGAAVDAVTYDSSLSSSDGISFNRNLDGSGQATAWVLHPTLSSLGSSPGKRVDGKALSERVRSKLS
jgi:hypothetical protein